MLGDAGVALRTEHDQVYLELFKSVTVCFESNASANFATHPVPEETIQSLRIGLQLQDEKGVSRERHLCNERQSQNAVGKLLVDLDESKWTSGIICLCAWVSNPGRQDGKRRRIH